MPFGDKEMKILVVDDFQVMRVMLKTLLGQIGYKNIVEAEDGDQALTILKRDDSVEFILSDWDMPNMNGLEFLKAVRGDKRFEHLPFILVTAESDKSKVDEAYEEGCNSYITKPFTTETLRDKIGKVISQLKKKAS